MEQQQCAPAQGAAVLRCAHRAVRQGLLATLARVCRMAYALCAIRAMAGVCFFLPEDTM